LRRIETVMQRLELALLAKLPISQQKLITEGQPVVLQITVLKIENSHETSGVTLRIDSIWNRVCYILAILNRIAK
jgi:hypothetical protein